jgi:hypothetical protein
MINWKQRILLLCRGTYIQRSQTSEGNLFVNKAKEIWDAEVQTLFKMGMQHRFMNRNIGFME